MNSWTRLPIILSVVLGAWLGDGALSQTPPTTTPPQGGAKPLKFLFSSRQELLDVWGSVHIGVTPVRLVREVTAPEFSVISAFPLSDGRWEVFGQQFQSLGRGRATHEETNTWKIVRATTRDGVSHENPEVVLEESPGPWTQHAVVAYNPESKEYLLLKLKMDSYGFAYTAYFSADGKGWSAHPGNPLFYEGDAMSLFWSPALKRYVVISKSLQPYRKRLRDHGGTTRALSDETMRDRRVLMMRSSPDGRRWEPSVSLPDVWDRHGQKAAHPPGYLTLPDAEDPPDLEFYSGNGFWYHDRAYMMVLNYAASPLTASKHAPHLDNEWWTSPDGLRWERPARGVNALEVFPQIPRLETPPLILGGMILFPRGNLLLGLPEDRISFVSARANAEFSTRSFVMPDRDLVLNAAVPGGDRLFAKEQAYVMAAVLDASGAVVPGFEAEKCVIREQDRSDIPLRWGEASSRSLAGRTVRVRFSLRSANLYALSAASGNSP